MAAAAEGHSLVFSAARRLDCCCERGTGEGGRPAGVGVSALASTALPTWCSYADAGKAVKKALTRVDAVHAAVVQTRRDSPSTYV